MIAFAGQTPVLSFFGQQPLEESDSEYMTSYRIIVEGKSSISRDDIQVIDSNGWNVSILDDMQDTSLSTTTVDDSYMIQISNDVTDKMQQYWVYCLGDDETAESIGEEAKYVINANGSKTSTALIGKWVEDSTGWWYDNGDGTYPTNAWKVINQVYYYFGADGYMLQNTTTPDGHKVDANGAWVEETDESLEEWKEEFRANWKNAYEKASDDARIDNPRGLGPVKYTFTMPHIQEATKEIIEELGRACAMNSYPRHFDYWFKYHYEGGVLTITAVSSVVEIPESMMN